jgi:hypothetical protein
MIGNSVDFKQIAIRVHQTLGWFAGILPFALAKRKNKQYQKQ